MAPFILYNSILVDADSVAASDTASGYDAANLSDLRPYTYWIAANATGDKTITVDYGAAVSCGALAVVGHNLGTVGSTLALASSATGAFAGEQTARLSGKTCSDDLAAAWSFVAASARYWRLTISGSAAAPMIGCLLLGPRLDFPSMPVGPHIPARRAIEAERAVSKAGHLLGATYRYEPVRISASWRKIAESFATSDFLTFWTDHGRYLKPFVWVLDATSYPRAWFVSLAESASHEYPVQIIGTAESLELDMVGVTV